MKLFLMLAISSLLLLTQGVGLIVSIVLFIVRPADRHLWGQETLLFVIGLMFAIVSFNAVKDYEKSLK